MYGKTPVDIIVSGIGKLGINENCKGYGKSALFQTHSILDASNQGYESDSMSKVHLEYDCYEELHVKFNLSTLNLNASFKQFVSYLHDLKFASRRISDVETNHMSNESLVMAQEDVPLRELNSRTPDAKPRRSNRLRTSKSCLSDQLKCKSFFPKGEMFYTGVICRC